MKISMKSFGRITGASLVGTLLLVVLFFLVTASPVFSQTHDPAAVMTAEMAKVKQFGFIAAAIAFGMGAIAAGIADGLGFGANSRSALITRGLAEITRLGVELGGMPETFMGLAGLGDLILTCTDDQSRNRRLGLALAQGVPLDQAVNNIGQAIEGIHTTFEVIKLAQRLSIEMPISEQVYAVLTGRTDPKTAVQNLLSRDPKQELE